jgi:hypothetical protein
VSTRRLRALGVVVATVLLTGGCAAGTHPGAAAMVGDTEISLGDVDKTSRAVGAALGQAYPGQAALNGMVSNELAAQVGKQKSISVSDAEIADAAKNAVAPSAEAYQKLQADPASRAFLDKLAATVISTIKLAGGEGIHDTDGQQKAQEGVQALNAASKDIKVTVAPRFGQWSDGRLDTAISGSLSKESAQTEAKRKAAEEAQQQQGQG